MNGDLISRSALHSAVCLNTNYGTYGEFMDGSEVSYTSREVHTMINEAPAVDAVEVVRCEDCIHRGDDICCPMCFEEESVIDEGDGYFDTDYITHDRTVDDGFCDRGERRVGE